MAKKKKAKKASVMDAFTDSALKDMGPGGVFVREEGKTRHIGVPLPALSLEFLLGSNVLWLGASYGLAGPTQSFKSSLAFELMRIVLQLGGIGWTVETEGGKISDLMIDSILGKLRDQHRLLFRDNAEGAQEALTYVLGWFAKKFPKNDKLGALMLDSLFGAAGQEKRKAIEKDGHASRSFPVEALIWSSWLQSFSPTLRIKPAILLFVNHLKKQMEGDSWRHPGGDAQDFHSTVYLHVNKVRTYDGSDIAITQLQVKTVKHSYFLPGRRIFVPYVFDKIANRMYFDWSHSTADLLCSDLVPSTAKKVLDVKSTAKNVTALSRTFSCKQLGVKEATGTEMGDMIHKDTALMEQLREALRINKYDVWGGIMPVALDEEHDPDHVEEVDDGEVDDSLDI